MKIDYSPFLFVGDDREIWWPLEIAAKLVAGYLPVCDDDQNLNPELRATSNRVRENERSVYAYFNQDPPPIKLPHIEIRDGAQFVRAREFLIWLDDYGDATNTPIDIPGDLAKLVAQALEASQASAGKTFTSLAAALSDYYDTPFARLPKSIRQRVEREFQIVGWDGLAPGHRRQFADQWDMLHNPALAEEHQRWFDFYARIDEIEDEIKKWENTSSASTAENAARDEKLSQLRAKRDAMRAVEKAENKRSWAQRLALTNKPHREKDGPLIAFPKALTLLKRRLNASPDEIAIWVWLTRPDGGLSAYRKPDGEGEARPFFFELGIGTDFDYRGKLMGTWYDVNELEQFNPKDRFISGRDLLARWSKLDGIEVVPFVRAKIEEGRLQDLHPIFGGTQWSEGDGTPFPSKDDAMFELSLVEAIEQEDFDQALPVDSEHQSDAIGSDNGTACAHATETTTEAPADPDAADTSGRVAAESKGGESPAVTATESEGADIFEGVHTESAAPLLDPSPQPSSTADAPAITSPASSADAIDGAQLLEPESGQMGSAVWRQLRARDAANARHAKSKSAQAQIREIWASGKYTSRDVCAEQECAALGISFSTARKALRGTPEPAPRTESGSSG